MYVTVSTIDDVVVLRHLISAKRVTIALYSFKITSGVCIRKKVRDQNEERIVVSIKYFYFCIPFRPVDHSLIINNNNLLIM